MFNFSNVFAAGHGRRPIALPSAWLCACVLALTVPAMRHLDAKRGASMPFPTPLKSLGLPQGRRFLAVREGNDSKICGNSGFWSGQLVGRWIAVS
jgi:hypothetical protein